MPSATLQTGGFNVLRNQSALPTALLGSIRDVRVEHEVSVPGMFSFTLNMVSQSGGSAGAGLDVFAPGDDITILLGRDRLQRMIVGQITAIEPRFGPYSTATIRGFDRMYRLQFGQQTRAFENLGDDTIAQEVARSAGLTIRVEGDPTTINKYVKQRDQSNYDFLMERAKQLNYELLMDGTTLVFRPSGEGAGPVRTLSFPKDLSRVDLDLRVPTQGAVVTVYGFDPDTNTEIKAVSSGASQRDLMGGEEVGYETGENFPSSAITIQRPDISDVEALQTIADARYQAELERFIKGSATLTGDPALVAGVNVKITGLSQRFDGIYYITNSVHTYDDDAGYATEVQLRRTGV